MLFFFIYGARDIEKKNQKRKRRQKRRQKRASIMYLAKCYDTLHIHVLLFLIRLTVYRPIDRWLPSSVRTENKRANKKKKRVVSSLTWFTPTLTMPTATGEKKRNKKVGGLYFRVLLVLVLVCVYCDLCILFDLCGCDLMYDDAYTIYFTSERGRVRSENGR